MNSSAQLRLMSDLKTIQQEPPEGCSASPLSDDNLFVWQCQIFVSDLLFPSDIFIAYVSLSLVISCVFLALVIPLCQTCNKLYVRDYLF